MRNKRRPVDIGRLSGEEGNVARKQRINVIAFTAGRDNPAARFRVRQYVDSLARHEIQVTEQFPRFRMMFRAPGILRRIRRRYLFPWMIVQMLLNCIARAPSVVAAWRYDVVLINRSILPGLEEIVHLLPRPRILDVDDAIWLTDPRGKRAAARLARSVDGVIAGNEYLASWYRQYNENVFVVETAVDTDKYQPSDELARSEKEFITIGWMGTRPAQLDTVKAALEEVLDTIPKSRLLIVSNARPSGWGWEHKRTCFRQWRAEREVADLQDMDIGIMPLEDDEFTRGKCSYKMLLYLSVGIPVVVSPVGMNQEVLANGHVGFAATSHEQWVSLLVWLCRNFEARNKMGMAGRKVVHNIYSRHVLARKVETAIRRITSD